MERRYPRHLVHPQIQLIPLMPLRGNFKIATGLMALAMTLILVSGCVRNPATRKVHAKLLSYESERKIGEETKKKILEQYQVLNSTTVAAYVSKVGQKLANVSDRPTVDFDFTVLDSDLVNAFAAPGGFIFVTRGLMEDMEDESELAMVLGHEIAHVTALHGVQIIQKEMGQNALTILGSIGAAIALGPEALILVSNTASLFSSLYLLGYSRDKELEADNLGLQYLLRAGYDPTASVRFLKKLEHEGQTKVAGWDLYFRTHPQTSERISIINNMVGTDKKVDDAKTGREAYEKILEYLPKVDAAERGTIKDHKYTNEFHRLSIVVPSNWELGFFQHQSLISFRTNDNKAEGRLQVVRMGTTTPKAPDLASSYAKSFGYEFVTGREVLYQAGYGYLGQYRGISARGEPMDIRIFMTVRRNRGYALVIMAPYTNLPQYFLDLEHIMREFKFT